MSVEVDKAVFVVDQVRHLTESTYVLRFSRNEMTFIPGQHLVLGLPGTKEFREYSIYSGIHENYLEVLIKEVDDGMVSKQLKSIKQGDEIHVRGPRGFFLTKAAQVNPGKLLFISSGTGLAPFHSFVKSYPESNYSIVHGVRNISEAYELGDFKRDQFTICTSRGERGDFPGRLTDYLLQKDLDPEARVFLCGNSNMIYDAMDILRAKGLPQKQIFTEVYF
ncbi:MAG: FAD-binding oxidoreductase [Bacteroides sp.]|nr:FAD-binding oxidoreductase [Bacteroides sp.]